MFRRFVRRHSKYGNKKIVIDDHKFDSIKEANRYRQLKYMQLAGQIKDLILQPEYVLQEAFKDASGKHNRAIKYVADFQYFDVKSNKTIIEDVKGMKTSVFSMKEKMFRNIYPDKVLILL